MADNGSHPAPYRLAGKPEIRVHLLATDHVRDLHAWTVNSSLPARSAHTVIGDTCFNDGCAPAA